MQKLSFDLEALKPIVEHALACKTHEPTASMQRDPKYWKEGAVPHVGGWAKPDDIDKAKIPPHLKLAKDTGVYLLSSGLPRLMDTHDPKGELSQVVYAQGMEPNDGWNAWQRAGGDDFVEMIPFERVLEIIASGAKRMSISLNEKTMRIEPEGVLATRAPAKDIDAPTRARPSYSTYEKDTAKGLAGVEKNPSWASRGQSYTGVVYGFDSHVMFQKSGRSLIVHEKALLPYPYPGKGSRVTIVYPENINEPATVERPTRARHATVGLER